MLLCGHSFHAEDSCHAEWHDRERQHSTHTELRILKALVLMAQVEDPSKYGVVVMDDSGKVERFVEKPKVSICAAPHQF